MLDDICIERRDDDARSRFSDDDFVKSVPATDVEKRLDAILDDAQRGAIVIRREDSDVAVVSVEEYERLRSGKCRRSSICAERSPPKLLRETAPTLASPICLPAMTRDRVVFD
jgi:hypothetical protein